MTTPDTGKLGEQPVMSAEALERITRMLAYTLYRTRGEDVIARELLVEEMAASDGDVVPLANTMVWLVGTVAELKPDDLSGWLEDTLGAAMASLMAHQPRPDTESPREH